MDLLAKLVARMLARTQKGMARGMQEAMSEVLDELVKSTLDPVKLAELMKTLGIDSSQFSGMMGRMPGVDPYRVLGLDKTASNEEVKKRYHERLRQFHPDTAGPGMEFHLQAVMTAYELIKRERGWQQ